MPRSLALIRGVGGPAALQMAELRSAWEDNGLSGVAALQVAGNVVFDQGDRSMQSCAALIRNTVRESFGHDLPVTGRSHEQLADAQRRNPFIGSPENRWVITSFLEETPHPSTALDSIAGPPDVFAVNGAEVFVRYVLAVVGSKLQSAWFGKRPGVVGAARHANTVAKLVQLSS